jgi:hypothetical protein
MHGAPWKADTMSIKFPSPKSTFQAFKTAFGAKPAARPQQNGGGPSVRTPFTNDLPRRNPAQAARQAPPPPRQAAPRRPAGMPGAGRNQAPFGANRMPTQGEKLLQAMSLQHIDKMAHGQVAEVVAFLAGRHKEHGAAGQLANLGVPFQHNWKLMRANFSDLEMQALLLTKHQEVLDFLMRPARPAGPQAKPGPAPAPGAQHRWNQTPPRASGANAEPPRPKPGKPAISVIGLGRHEAVAELKARGVKPAELKAMSQAFSDYANFGGDELAAKFKKDFGHLVSDDITNSANRTKLALFFKGLARENHGA